MPTSFAIKIVVAKMYQYLIDQNLFILPYFYILKAQPYLQTARFKHFVHILL